MALAASLVVGVLGAAGVVGWVLSVADSAPRLSTLRPAQKGAVSRVYADNGQFLGFIQSGVLRTPVSAAFIPPSMRNAMVAVEDKRFFQHAGIDYEGVIRAAVKNLLSGSTVQGGSTLSMQLIRNLYVQDDARAGLKGYERKIKEAKLAQELEQQHPGHTGKEWILDTYLNVVPYGTVGGQQIIGIAAAARVFFDQQLNHLTLAETAMLAGLPQAPTDYNPFLFPAAARARRNDVLQRMADQGYISTEQARKAARAPLGVRQNAYYRTRHEAYFFDYVKQQLVNRYGAKRVAQGGLKVYTTIDIALQKLARHAIRTRLPDPSDPSAALVSIDPHDGHIKAMASSGNYVQSKFNLASQARRQPGSTFKVMVLMTALRRGVDINSTTYDSHPLNFFWPECGCRIDVTTDTGSYSGSTSLFEGLVASDNTVYQQADLDLGPENVRRTAYDMGITSHLDAYPAEGLGGLTQGVTPLEMARAYTTINTGGFRLDPVSITKVVLPDGRVDRSLGLTHKTKVFTDGQAAEARKAMEANVQRGTGTAAQLSGCTAAGKTGTTSSFVDAWFDGMTPNLTTAVWVGYPNVKTRTYMTDVPGYGEMFGGLAPAEIWHDFMQTASAPDCGAWPLPTEPFISQPFAGRFAGLDASGDNTGGTDTTATDSTVPADPAPQAPVPPPASAGDGTGGAIAPSG